MSKYPLPRSPHGLQDAKLLENLVSCWPLLTQSVSRTFFTIPASIFIAAPGYRISPQPCTTLRSCSITSMRTARWYLSRCTRRPLTRERRFARTVSPLHTGMTVLKRKTLQEKSLWAHHSIYLECHFWHAYFVVDPYWNWPPWRATPLPHLWLYTQWSQWHHLE